MNSMTALQKEIIDLCNKSGLPLECIVYVLKDAWRDAEATLRNMQAQFPLGVNPQENKEEE